MATAICSAAAMIAIGLPSAPPASFGQDVDRSREQRLLAAALGETSGGNAQVENAAAEELVALNPVAGLKLLPAANPRVRVIGSNAVFVLPMTPELLVEFKQLLRSSNPELSATAASYMARAPRGPLATEAVLAIGEALKAVSGRSDLGEFISPGVTDLNVEETLLLGYARALQLSHCGNRTIRELRVALAGNAKHAVTVALAGRGIESERDNLLAVILDSDAGMLRTSAVQATMYIGTPEDLPLLRRLAEEDPLLRPGRLNPSGSTERGEVYPVRRIAANMAYWIERKYRVPPESFPPPTPAQVQAWERIESGAPNSVNPALGSLDGRPLDPDQFEKVAGFLKGEDLRRRSIAARVLAHGSLEPEFAARAVALIGESLREVPDTPNADVRDAGLAGRTQSTLKEDLYSGYFSGLVDSYADDSELLKLRDQLEGIPRAIVIVALANRRNAGVHDELMQFIERDDTGLVRLWAIRALTEIALPTDLDLLRQVAETDPLMRENADDVGPPLSRPRLIYPVREEAAGAILRLEKRFIE